MSAPRGLPRSRMARAGIVALALVVAGGVTYLAWPRPSPSVPPAAAAGATPPRIPIAVTASRPHPGVPAVVGAPTVIGAHALGEAPIAALELWVGDERVAIDQADTPSPAFHTRFSWTPDEAGQQIAFTRALDALGRVRQSNAVRVEVMPADGEASAPRAVLADARQMTTTALALPAVQAEVDGCTVEIDVSELGPATGFTVYELPPDGSFFVPLASLPSGPGRTSYKVPADGGSSVFVIGAFDTSVEVLAAPITVAAPDECDDDGWSGGVSLVDGLLEGGPPVERAYLYLRQGDEAAQRVPTDPGTFVEADGTTLDFGDVLPGFAPAQPAQVEAWGWQGGQLVQMGSGTWTPPASPPGAPGGNAAALPGIPALGVGTATTLHTLITHQIPGPEPCGKEFCSVDNPVTQSDVVWPTINDNPSPERVLRWSTQMPMVDSIVWQILPYAPAPTADLTPPFVVDTGVIAVEPGTGAGEFTIDFGDYLGEATPTIDFGNQGPMASSLAGIFGTPGAPSTPLPPATPAPNGGGGSLGEVTDAGIGQLIPSSIGNQAYVRVIPMQGSTPTVPSNPVRFDVVPPPVPIEIDAPTGFGVNQDAYTVDWTFTPPQAADGHFARCAVVTGFTDDYVPPPKGFWPWSYAVGDVLCYNPPDDDGLLDVLEDGFEAFADFVEEVATAISDSYEWIQDQIVNVILTAVPCEQIADPAVCQAIAETALSVALASMGIPPTIPDFGTVMEGLKGDLRTLVLEAAKSQLPGVAEACGLAEGGQVVSDDLATCEALVDEAVDQIIEHVEAEVSAAAGAATGKAYPGVIFAPDPRGIYQPPSVTMTLTRTDDLPLPVECTATVSMTSTKDHHSWDELVGGWPKKVEDGTVTGAPFLPETFTIPPMEPGETMTRTVWLSDPAIYHESQAAYMYWTYYEALANSNRAWVLLTEGSQLTFEVTGNCMHPSEQGPHVLAESAID